jgi:hypothetical protein
VVPVAPELGDPVPGDPDPGDPVPGVPDPGVPAPGEEELPQPTSIIKAIMTLININIRFDIVQYSFQLTSENDKEGSSQV